MARDAASTNSRGQQVCRVLHVPGMPQWRQPGTSAHLRWMSQSTSKPASAGLASMQHELPDSVGSQHQPLEAARAASEQDLMGAYSTQGHVTPAHQQWCALLSLAGN